LASGSIERDRTFISSRDVISWEPPQFHSCSGTEVSESAVSEPKFQFYCQCIAFIFAYFPFLLIWPLKNAWKPRLPLNYAKREVKKQVKVEVKESAEKNDSFHAEL